MDKTDQFGRALTLVVYGADMSGLDLSKLRIKFSVKRSDTMTPNMADIRVYNLEEKTALKIQKEFKKIIFQAGYAGNYGVIFQGNIKQVIIGRESATDTFIDIIAGDGDRAYNFAVVNTTLAAGSTAQDQIGAALAPMIEKGVMAGNLGTTAGEKLPRGKVMYGNSKHYLRNIANSTEQSWSIQDEKLTFVPLKSYLPGERVVINAKTGQIGTPQQTTDGVNVKCLLNPLIRVGGRIELNNKNIEMQKLNLEQIAFAKGDTSAINRLIPMRLNQDGIYYVLTLEHSGDTRGVEWYTSMICLNIDVSANPLNSVQVGYG